MIFFTTNYKEIVRFTLLFFTYYVESEIVPEQLIDNVYEMPSSEYMGRAAKHPCDRQCFANDTGRICYYKFVVELHSTLGKVFR